MGASRGRGGQHPVGLGRLGRHLLQVTQVIDDRADITSRHRAGERLVALAQGVVQGRPEQRRDEGRWIGDTGNAEKFPRLGHERDEMVRAMREGRVIHQPRLFAHLDRQSAHLDDQRLRDRLIRGVSRDREGTVLEPSKVEAGSGEGHGGMQRQPDCSGLDDWGEHTQVGPATVHFVECQHRSGRGAFDQMKTLWGSFVVETPEGAIYFAGDTGYSPHFKAQGEQYGPFALSLLPIGAYEPRWFMKDIHLNPSEAVQAHLDLNSQQSLGIHFGVFQLTWEAIDSPITDLEAALDAQGLPRETFWVLEPGELATTE